MIVISLLLLCFLNNSMYCFFVVPKHWFRRDSLFTDITHKPSLVFSSLGLFAVKLTLVGIHIAFSSKKHVTYLALVLLQFTSGGVVFLVVGVQLFNRIVVTLADLTDDVSVCLLRKKTMTKVIPLTIKHPKKAEGG